MGHSWVSIAALGLLGLTCVFALLKGSIADKLGAMMVLALNLSADALLALCYPHTPQLALFTLDFMLAVGLLALAIRYSSLWLGAAMFLQSLALCSHAFRLGDSFGAVWWMILNNVISQLMLVCIMIATAVSWRARRKPAAQPASAFVIIGDATAH